MCFLKNTTCCGKTDWPSGCRQVEEELLSLRLVGEILETATAEEGVLERDAKRLAQLVTRKCGICKHKNSASEAFPGVTKCCCTFWGSAFTQTRNLDLPVEPGMADLITTDIN